MAQAGDMSIPTCRVLSDEAWLQVGASLKLSGREVQISRCVFADCKELAIASRLGISPHTVRTHMERIYHKLGVSSRVELVVRIVDEFLRQVRVEDSPLPPICANRTAGRCPFGD